jgi:hypothetical protein
LIAESIALEEEKPVPPSRGLDRTGGKQEEFIRGRNRNPKQSTVRTPAGMPYPARLQACGRHLKPLLD